MNFGLEGTWIPFPPRFYFPTYPFPWEGVSRYQGSTCLFFPHVGLDRFVCHPPLRIHPQSFGFTLPMERKESIRFDRSIRRWCPPIHAPLSSLPRGTSIGPSTHFGA